jgi:hypothetical protein
LCTPDRRRHGQSEYGAGCEATEIAAVNATSVLVVGHENFPTPSTASIRLHFAQVGQYQLLKLNAIDSHFLRI